MRIAALILLPLIACGQSSKAPATTNRPVCSRGAICFSGQVSAGETFRQAINSELDLILDAALVGWTIEVVPKRPEGECKEFAWVVNPPYRQHNALYIDTSYGWTAEDEMSYSPREFRFVTNCSDYGIESQRVTLVLWPSEAETQGNYDEALAKLGTSPAGAGRLWITDSKISHENDTADVRGHIKWMKFRVEIELPRERSGAIKK